MPNAERVFAKAMVASQLRHLVGQQEHKKGKRALSELKFLGCKLARKVAPEKVKVRIDFNQQVGLPSICFRGVGALHLPGMAGLEQASGHQPHVDSETWRTRFGVLLNCIALQATNGNREVAQDLVHETYACALGYCRLCLFLGEPVRSEKGLLTFILRTRASDYFRRRSTHEVPFSALQAGQNGGNSGSGSCDDANQSGFDPVDDKREADPARVAQRRELAGLIQEAKKKLTDHERRIFTLRLEEGLSANEVANRLNVTHQVVNGGLHRALNKLQRLLSLKGYGPCGGSGVSGVSGVFGGEGKGGRPNRRKRRSRA